MDKSKIKKHLPTIPNYLEKRKAAKRNQLPKHLRPPATWPLWIQLGLNSALIITLYNMMIDREDYLTEAGPAIVLVICLLLLIYTFISAFRLRRRYVNVPGQRLSKANIWLMGTAFIFWAGCIAVFLT